MLEKPVLFDVTERNEKTLQYFCYKLEKPVLFDVTERVPPCVFIVTITLEKPVLFDVTEPTLFLCHFPFFPVGKAGFIWCHGTKT